MLSFFRLISMGTFWTFRMFWTFRVGVFSDRYDLMWPSGLNVTVCWFKYFQPRTLVKALNHCSFDKHANPQIFSRTFLTHSFLFDSTLKYLLPSKSLKSKSMLLLVLCFSIFTPASVRSDRASNLEAATNPDDLIEKGILFNEVSIILLTEKLFRVEFLVTFPTYGFTVKPASEKTIEQLSLLWETPFLSCPLNFSSHFATNTSEYNVNWMLHQVDHEISAAEIDLELTRNDTVMFLSLSKPP